MHIARYNNVVAASVSSLAIKHNIVSNSPNKCCAFVSASGGGNINYGLGLILELLICEKETRTRASASKRSAI
jgi:hypothetical protein